MRKILIAFLMVLLSSVLYADGTESGIIVYTMKGCPRCEYVVKAFGEKSIGFTERVTEDKKNLKSMWAAVRETGTYKGGSITMPVVVVRGKTFYSIENLDQFVTQTSSSSGIASDDTKKPDVSPDGNSSITDFGKNVLDRHNYYRRMHGVPDVKWSSVIQKYAQEWAEKLAAEDRMYHRQPNKYGENIYWYSGGDSDGTDAVNAWYSEIKNYNYAMPVFSMTTGHFTQVVWKGTTEIGCGKARSKSGNIYVVCNYSPPGNYRGQFKSNVTELRSSDK
jgi:uncharacterized protein YkwD